MILRLLSQSAKQSTVLLNKCIIGSTRLKMAQPYILAPSSINITNRRHQSSNEITHIFSKDFVPVTPPPVPKVEILGAILPLSEQAFIQKLFFPYTYAVMYYMDFLTSVMPWWASIVMTTATIKLIFFPLLIKQQRVIVRSHNILPETQKLQVKINNAMVAGDTYASAMNRAKLKMLYEENDISLRERLWPVLIQVPAFMTFFFLLRKLASEVESMKTGGTLWFTDLSIPDPTYLLPLMTSLSMLALMELGIGAEGASGGATATMRPVARWSLRGLPVVMFAFIQSFPAGTLLFWTTNNFLTLVFTVIITRTGAKKFLRIPNRIKHDSASLPLTNQSFTGQLKQAKEMSQASRTTLDLRRLDDIAFRKAGVGPLRKTYKTPPAQPPLEGQVK